MHHELLLMFIASLTVCSLRTGSYHVVYAAEPVMSLPTGLHQKQSQERLQESSLLVESAFLPGYRRAKRVSPKSSERGRRVRRQDYDDDFEFNFFPEFREAAVPSRGSQSVAPVRTGSSSGTSRLVQPLLPGTNRFRNSGL